jgi:hypothetical protein
MRISIVFDDNGTILAASVAGEDANKPASGPGVSSGYFDLPDDMPDAELRQAVERVLIDLDASELTQSPT